MPRAWLLHAVSGFSLLVGVDAAHAQSTESPGPSAESPTAAGEAAGIADPGQEIANAPPADAASGGEIIVTGSRVVRDSTRSPTPLLVTSAEQLARAAPSTVAESLVQLPVFRGSSTPQSTGTSANGSVGASLLNLRGLGAQRTLVLLDGRRVGPSNTDGTTDVSLFPESLVSRVDVVTGGASAAYGSDAVAGVANFVLDTDFTGLKGVIQSGLADAGDSPSIKASLAFGRSFANDRGHIVISAEYFDRSGLKPEHSGRGWQNAAPGVIPNPDPSALPHRFLVDGVTLSAANYGGLVASGPLRGTTFGPGGTVEQFEFGTLVGPLFMVGGDGIVHSTNLSASLTRKTVFAHAAYEVADGVDVYLEGSYGQVKTPFDQYYPFNYLANSANIFTDNAYLPAELKEKMIDLGVDSIPVGRIYSEFPFVGTNARRSAARGVAGFSAQLSSDWELSGYYSHSDTRARVVNYNDPIHRNFYAAVDAVVDPATNKVVCRSTLAGYDPGCEPLNILGVGAPSQKAIDYVLGDNSRKLRLKQDVAALTLQGKIFSLWSDPIAVAAGVEYRRESAVQTVDALSSIRVDFTGLRGAPAGRDNQLGSYLVGNPQPISGKYTVKEGFFELLVPVVSDQPFLNRLDLNGAVRLTDYSTSGSVTTWKVGVIYAPVPDIRFRATRSRDIRGPNINELFSGGVQSLLTIRDPETGETVPITGLTRGNPDLDPEVADTFTAGVVLEPSWIPNLNVAVDYYDIDVEGAIDSLSAQRTVDECYQGSQIACDSITNIGGQLRIDLPQRNLSSLKTSGIDIDAGYRTSLGSGSLSFRLLANRLLEFETTSPGLAPVDRAGQVGLASYPKWVGSFSVNYEQGGFGLFVQERYINGGTYDATFVEGVDINDNSIPAVWYTDLTLTQKIRAGGGEAQFYFTINNLFNKAPPATPLVQASLIPAANWSLYDVLGRYYTFGLRFNF